MFYGEIGKPDELVEHGDLATTDDATPTRFAVVQDDVAVPPSAFGQRHGLDARTARIDALPEDGLHLRIGSYP